MEINKYNDPICSEEEKSYLLKQKTKIDEELVVINVTITEIKNVLQGIIFEISIGTRGI